MTLQTPVNVDQLLEQERWAFRLARALVGDEDEAHDLVQDASVAFLRRPPKDETRTRPWLGTVVRNLARSRAHARQREVTPSSGPPDRAATAPTPEELAQRFAMHRLLADLVGELREPFRQAILLRYYEGLNAADIARRLDVPAGTVRWRLKTGLAPALIPRNTGLSLPTAQALQHRSAAGAR